MRCHGIGPERSDLSFLLTLGLSGASQEPSTHATQTWVAWVEGPVRAAGSRAAAKVLLSALRTRFGTKRCAKRRRRRAMSVCA